MVVSPALVGYSPLAVIHFGLLIFACAFITVDPLSRPDKLLRCDPLPRFDRVSCFEPLFRLHHLSSSVRLS